MIRHKASTKAKQKQNIASNKLFNSRQKSFASTGQAFSEQNCSEKQSFWQSFFCKLGRGNLMTVLIGLMIVVSGRFAILSLAVRIPQQEPGLTVHQILPINLNTESQIDMQGAEVSLDPFERLNENNHIEVSASDVTATDDYWNLDWWSQYLLRKMPEVHDNLLITGQRKYWIYRDDGIIPKPGVRTEKLTNEWLLSESSLSNDFDWSWSLKTAWNHNRGLVYFRMDAPQYLHGELKADDAILEQASKSARVFVSHLTEWLLDVTSPGLKAPVATLASWPGQPESYKMEGMICHVIFEDPQTNTRFTVFYNVAIMQVVGFAGQ